MRILRRIANVQRELAVQTVAFAVSYSGSRPYGPASALKHYLNQVDWHLDIHGNVTGPEHYGCNILNDSIKKIVNTFRSMWVYNIVWSMDRKGIGDFLPYPTNHQAQYRWWISDQKYESQMGQRDGRLLRVLWSM